MNARKGALLLEDKDATTRGRAIPEEVEIAGPGLSALPIGVLGYGFGFRVQVTSGSQLQTFCGGPGVYKHMLTELSRCHEPSSWRSRRMWGF